jgi:hypothetical protein
LTKSSSKVNSILLNEEEAADYSQLSGRQNEVKANTSNANKKTANQIGTNSRNLNVNINKVNNSATEQPKKTKAFKNK